MKEQGEWDLLEKERRAEMKTKRVRERSDPLCKFWTGWVRGTGTGLPNPDKLVLVQ